MNPDYFYPDAKSTVDLAKTAQELFKNQDALLLLNKFSQHYPNNEQIPYAYFIVAQLMFDYKQEEEQAHKILLSLLNKYPGHELTTQIKNYLGVVDKFRKPVSK
jgi:outer membrane protein assembly factor BamD (BamD/ComL family)